MGAVVQFDQLRLVSFMLSDRDIACFRLVCAAFCTNSERPATIPRSSFMHSVSAALVAFAHWQLHGSASLLSIAASVGNVEVVAWLRAVGCDWSADLPARAAENGHLDVLRWLHNTAALGMHGRALLPHAQATFTFCAGLYTMAVLGAALPAHVRQKGGTRRYFAGCASAAALAWNLNTCSSCTELKHLACTHERADQGRNMRDGGGRLPGHEAL